MRRFVRALLLVAVTSAASLICCITPLAADEKPVFRAGAALVNITPPLGEPIVGGFQPFPSTDVHDELHARCLVLDDGTNKLAFVICDSLHVKQDVFDEARALIVEEAKIPAENILLAATHTHSATPSSSDKYRPFFVRRIADAVKMALTHLEPAQIGWGSVDEPSQVFNRRWYVTDRELCKNPFGGYDTVRMNPPQKNPALVRPAGPVDPEVSFISVRAIDGRPISLLANYSLHYVGGVRGGEISADYFGIFSRRIGELLQADSGKYRFVGMLSNGTSGDVNNINFPEGWPRAEPYERMNLVAELLAQRVHAAHSKIEYQDWVPLKGATRNLTLKVRKPDAAMREYFAEVMAKPEDAPKYHAQERVYASRVQALYEGPDQIEILLQAVRIGDLSIAAIPFEVFTEIGLEIKEKTPFGRAFTIELANGSNGYLPTPAQHEIGGYETWLGTNRVQFDASVLITDTLLELMQELNSKP